MWREDGGGDLSLRAHLFEREPAGTVGAMFYL